MRSLVDLPNAAIDEEFRATESAVEYVTVPENKMSRRNELEGRLRELEAHFADQMRKRGFDPAQADNIALPSALAKLFAAREEIKSELEELISDDRTGGQT
jgi:hypothetical protein